MLAYLAFLHTEEEKEKFTLLYETYRDKMYYVAFSMLKEEGKSEDVVHETFLVLIDHLDAIESEAYRILKKYQKEKKKNPSLQLSVYLEKRRGKACHKAWNYIVTILKNKIYDLFRKENRDKKVDIDDFFLELPDDSGQEPEKLIVKKEEIHFMKNAISKLPYPYKEVLILQYYNALPAAQIGKILGKSPEHIRQIAKRGRERLKKEMEKGGYRHD